MTGTDATVVLIPVAVEKSSSELVTEMEAAPVMPWKKTTLAP